MKEKMEQIIFETLAQINEELQDERLHAPTLKTKLYGANGTLDSLALVSFVTDLEEKISDEFDKNIILADEKAMSQSTSPFRNIQTLSEYIQTLLKEN